MVLARTEVFNLLSIAYLLYCLRARNWPPYYSINLYPFLGVNQPLINPLDNNPDILLDQN